MTKDELNALVERENRILREVADLLASGVRPEELPIPYRKMFAQAVIPFRDSRSLIESRKGLRLLGSFFPGLTTFERIPGWIRQEVEARDPKEERTAERLRADLSRAFRIARRKRNFGLEE